MHLGPLKPIFYGSGSQFGAVKLLFEPRAASQKKIIDAHIKKRAKRGFLAVLGVFLAYLGPKWPQTVNSWERDPKPIFDGSGSQFWARKTTFRASDRHPEKKL